MFLLGHMDWNETQISDAILKSPDFFWQGVPLNEYWNFHKINPIPFRKYLNSGLIIGKAKHLRKSFKWILDNGSSFKKPNILLASRNTSCLSKRSKTNRKLR